MCAVSMISDRYGQMPKFQFNNPMPDYRDAYIKLLEAAKQFDTTTGQPDCEKVMPEDMPFC